MSTSSWAPSVDDVGAILRARTQDNNGNELGTFSSNTRPTDDDVNNLIDQATDDVLDMVGQNVPTDLEDNAAKVVAIGAALLVELSFFPEQVGSGRSPYAQLKAMYDDRLKRLLDTVAHEGADVPGTEYMVPAGAFGGPVVPIHWYLPW